VPRGGGRAVAYAAGSRSRRRPRSRAASADPCAAACSTATHAYERPLEVKEPGVNADESAHRPPAVPAPSSWRDVSQRHGYRMRPVPRARHTSASRGARMTCATRASHGQLMPATSTRSKRLAPRSGRRAAGCPRDRAGGEHRRLEMARWSLDSPSPIETGVLEQMYGRRR